VKPALAAVVRGWQGWLRRVFVTPECPLVAVELRPRAAAAARFRKERRRLVLDAAASLELPEGALQPSLAEPNVGDAEAVRGVLASVIDRVGGVSGGRIALVLPDPVARIRCYPASEVAGKGARETEDLIRFRLQKAVPFDAREARVSHAVVGQGEGRRVLAVAMFRPVLEGYEAVVDSLGLEAGIVDLSGLSLLGAVDARLGDQLLVNWDEGYVSFLLTRDAVPLLVRTLTEEAVPSLEHVAREAASTAMYYAERLGGPGLSGCLVRSTAALAERAVEALREPLGVTPEPLALRDGGSTPVPNELAAAAACVLGRAA
jgi:hypothetical protein